MFGITNIIIGVIVDATADTKSKIEWSQKRERTVELGLKWEKRIWAAGLRTDNMESLGENEKAEKEKERARIVEEIIQSVIDDDLEKSKKGATKVFPPGIDRKEF